MREDHITEEWSTEGVEAETEVGHMTVKSGPKSSEKEDASSASRRVTSRETAQRSEWEEWVVAVAEEGMAMTVETDTEVTVTEVIATEAIVREAEIEKEITAEVLGGRVTPDPPIGGSTEEEETAECLPRGDATVG